MAFKNAIVSGGSDEQQPELKAILFKDDENQQAERVREQQRRANQGNSGRKIALLCSRVVNIVLL